MASNLAKILTPTIDESELTYHNLIGHGGFGEVYKVTWKSKELGDIEAAAKKIPVIQAQGITEDVANEIKYLQTLKHPNIIQFYGLAVTENHIILVIEYADKGCLFDYLKNKTHLPHHLKAKWVRQIAEGIKYLSDHHVLHRDIKTPNLLITAESDLKICDFGISTDLTSTKTTGHTDKGSIKWQAPEIFKDGKLSLKADIFALGVVFWELETCKVPYDGDASMHVMYKVGMNDARPEIPDSCPYAMKYLIEMCWLKDRQKRPNIDQILHYLVSTNYGTSPVTDSTLTLLEDAASGQEPKKTCISITEAIYPADSPQVLYPRHIIRLRAGTLLVVPRVKLGSAAAAVKELSKHYYFHAFFAAALKIHEKTLSETLPDLVTDNGFKRFRARQNTAPARLET